MYFPSLARFYNHEKLQNVFVTLDLDWAPDFVLDFTLQWFWSQGISVTAFATHKTEVLLREKNNSLLEIGIHPNISRGKSSQQAVSELREFYPESIGSRTHRNMCGRDIFDELKDKGLHYDVSKFLWQHTHAECTPVCNGLVEAAYVWEDGVHIEMGLPLKLNEVVMNTPGLKIINFHPVLFYINCTKDEQRKKLVSNYADLTQAPESVFKAAKNTGYGIGDFSRDLILDLKRQGCKFHLLKDMMSEAFYTEKQLRQKRFHEN